jgi:hypothetical protein
MKSLWIVVVAFVALVALPRSANAQTQPFELTVTVTGHVGEMSGTPADHLMTFSAPVQIPGVALAPGAYVFRFVAPSVVQVLNSDRSEVYAMFHTTPASRDETSDRYGVTFQRLRDDAPLRIVAWFLPDRSIGFEPVYSKEAITAEGEVG